MSPAPDRRALLVDDSRFDYLDMRNLLLGSQAGVAHLEWLQSWPGSTEALDRGPFDLCFVDMHLGSASGLDVIRDLRAAGVRVPVIALTGQANDEIDRACAEAGASDFLVKGLFDRTMLERSIRYAEQQAATQRELDRLNAALERRAIAENDQARLMRFAVEQSSDGVFITGAPQPGGGLPIVFVNAALCAMVGKRAGALLGCDAPALFAAGPSLLDAATLSRATTAMTGEFDLRGADRTLPVRVRVTPLRSSSDDLEHFVWSCQAVDAPDRRARRDQRRTRHETIGQLAGGLAHDLNERVTVLTGNLELLAQHLAEAPGARLLDAATGAAERLGAQARLLMAFAQQDDSAIADVDVASVVARIEPLLQHAAGRLIRIETSHDADLWRARADAGRLELALIEVALDARDAMPDGGALHIAARNVSTDTNAHGAEPAGPDAANDYVAVACTHASEGTRTARPDGAIELARVRQAIRASGGLLDLAGIADDGTTATLYLPRAPFVATPRPTDRA